MSVSECVRLRCRFEGEVLIDVESFFSIVCELRKRVEWVAFLVEKFRFFFEVGSVLIFSVLSR